MNTKKFLISLSFLLLSPQIQAQTAFENWDVSVLYPFPNMQTIEAMISTNNHSELLPYKLFEKTQFLINQPDSETYKLMKVVAIRIDPCFSEGPAPRTCEKQMRMIWQPLIVNGDSVDDIDASVHVFFKLTDAQFLNLLKDIVELKSQFGLDQQPLKNQPLDVHPYLKFYGLNSPFATQFNSLMATWAGRAEMNRLTFMKLKGTHDIWIFGGFLINGNSVQDIQIPLINNTAQDFINSLAARPNPRGFLGGIFPEPEDADFPLGFIVRDSENVSSQSEDELVDAVRAIAKFENPQLHNPGTVDCVSCHLTTTVRSWIFENYSTVNLETIYESERYKNPETALQNITPHPAQANRLRMFGYFETQPAIGQRTINETAEVLKSIRALTKEFPIVHADKHEQDHGSLNQGTVK